MSLEEKVDALAALFHERSAQQFMVSLSFAEELAYLNFERRILSGAGLKDALRQAYHPYLMLNIVYRQDKDSLEMIQEYWEANKERLVSTWREIHQRNERAFEELDGLDFEALWRKPVPPPKRQRKSKAQREFEKSLE